MTDYGWGLVSLTGFLVILNIWIWLVALWRQSDR